MPKPAEPTVADAGPAVSAASVAETAMSAANPLSFFATYPLPRTCLAQSTAWR
jgi:hypothetical protein